MPPKTNAIRQMLLDWEDDFGSAAPFFASLKQNRPSHKCQTENKSRMVDSDEDHSVGRGRGRTKTKSRIKAR